MTVLTSYAHLIQEGILVEKLSPLDQPMGKSDWWECGSAQLRVDWVRTSGPGYS